MRDSVQSDRMIGRGLVAGLSGSAVTVSAVSTAPQPAEIQPTVSQPLVPQPAAPVADSGKLLPLFCAA